MNVLKRVPIPITGLFLALLTTGNLVASYGETYRNIFGILGTFVFLLILSKLLIYPGLVKTELENPLVFGVFATFFMGVMLLSTYIKPYLPSAAPILWYIGIALHAIYILIFIKKFILKFNMKTVFPSWFIVFVGIVVASVTSPLYGREALGRGIFWFGIITYFLTLPLVLYRVIKVKGIPEPAMPSLAIFAAPLSLCLAGYMNSFSEKNMTLIIIILVLSTISFIGVLLQLPRLLRIKFCPSFSAFTFPLAITALSLKLTNGYMMSTERNISFLKYVIWFEELLAVIIVLYVFIRYMMLIFSSKQESSC